LLLIRKQKAKQVGCKLKAGQVAIKNPAASSQAQFQGLGLDRPSKIPDQSRRTRHIPRSIASRKPHLYIMYHCTLHIKPPLPLLPRILQETVHISYCCNCNAQLPIYIYIILYVRYIYNTIILFYSITALLWALVSGGLRNLHCVACRGSDSGSGGSRN
jgi:hypothetical protein